MHVDLSIVKEEFDIDDTKIKLEVDADAQTSSQQIEFPSISSDALKIIEERPNMITVSVNEQQSEDERAFLAQMLVEQQQLFADPDSCISWHKCVYCSMRFNAANELEAHITLHRLNKHFCLHDCGVWCDTLEECLQHEHLEHSCRRGRPRCGLCNALFSDTSSLNKHMETHQFVPRFICALCRWDYPYRNGLLSHWNDTSSLCGQLHHIDERNAPNIELVRTKGWFKREMPSISGAGTIPNKRCKLEEPFSDVQIKNEPVEDEPGVTIKEEPLDEHELNNNNNSNLYNSEPQSNVNLSTASPQYTPPPISKLRLPALKPNIDNSAKRDKVPSVGVQKEKQKPQGIKFVPAPKKFAKSMIKVLPFASDTSQTSKSQQTQAATGTAKPLPGTRPAAAGVPIMPKPMPLPMLASSLTVSAATTTLALPLVTVPTQAPSSLVAMPAASNILQVLPSNCVVINLPANIRIVKLPGNNDGQNVSNLPALSCGNSIVLTNVTTNMSTPSTTITTTSTATATENLENVKQNQNQFDEPQERHNYFNNCFFDKIEKLPESRKIIEELQTKIRDIEKTLPLPGTVLQPSRKKVIHTMKEKIKPTKEEVSTPDYASVLDEELPYPPRPLLVDMPTATAKRSALNQIYPGYSFVWSCPKCAKCFGELYQFHQHLALAHNVELSQMGKELVQLKPFKIAVDENQMKTSTPPINVLSVTQLNKVAETERIAPAADPAQPAASTSIEELLAIAKASDSSTKIELRRRPKSETNEHTISPSKKVESKPAASTTTSASKQQASRNKRGMFQCQECHKSFTTPGSLNTHKLIHTGELPHQCSYCEKRFRTRAQVRVHHRRHTGEKPFKCKVCSLAFTHRETLISHLSRHIGMKRYKCYGCDKYFVVVSGLRAHRRLRPDTCGKVKFTARAHGPRVRVIRGEVVFEHHPEHNGYLRSEDPLKILSEIKNPFDENESTLDAEEGEIDATVA